MTQQPLFPVPPVLTGRQQTVLELVDRDGIAPADAGHTLHLSTGCRFCNPDRACQYAESAGREVLEALRKKELIRRDRHHRYFPLDRGGHPQEGDIPF